MHSDENKGRGRPPLKEKKKKRGVYLTDGEYDGCVDAAETKGDSFNKWSRDTLLDKAKGEPDE